MGMHQQLIEKLRLNKGQIPTIGRRAGVKSTTIQNWITGGHVPAIDKAEKVLNAMGYEIVIISNKRG